MHFASALFMVGLCVAILIGLLKILRSKAGKNGAVRVIISIWIIIVGMGCIGSVVKLIEMI